MSIIMLLSSWSFCVVVLLIHPALAKLPYSSEKEHVSGESASTAKEQQERLTKLFQLDPVERNHVQKMKLQSGQTLQIRTLAKEPPLFEIPGFLSDEECEHIKQLALKQGLFTSSVKGDNKDEHLQEEEGLFTEDIFNDIDSNGDKVLDPEELLENIGDLIGINAFLRQEDISKMLRENNIDLNDDGTLDLQEFSVMNSEKIKQIEEWMKEHCKGDDTKLNRFSKQAWLYQDGSDKILTDLRQRVIALTGLPGDVVETSEPLQVVYYDPGGHFHAHYDSEELDPELPCSHTVTTVHRGWNHDKGIRLCRFLTILYYLDDTLEGGETAFPVADNETFSEENLNNDLYDLSQHCHNANLYVRPAKGKAVMWYNHYVNETTGWVGQMNQYSLHGGCDVRQGTKWIANNWITIDDSHKNQFLYMESKANLKGPIIKHETDSFTEALQNMTALWAAYIQSSAGAESVKNIFSRELPLQIVMDNLVDYTSEKAAEIHVAWESDESSPDYKIIWQDVLYTSSNSDEGIFLDLIQAANAYAHNSAAEDSITSAKPPIILKNPHHHGEYSNDEVTGESVNINQVDDEIFFEERDEL